MEEFEINGNTFRIKKMNAIELLALRDQIVFDDFDSSEKAYLEILSKIEVKIKEDQWLQVRQGNNFYPIGIEDDIVSIEALVLKVIGYLKEVFRKSNSSKKETE